MDQADELIALATQLEYQPLIAFYASLKGEALFLGRDSPGDLRAAIKAFDYAKDIYLEYIYGPNQEFNDVVAITCGLPIPDHEIYKVMLAHTRIQKGRARREAANIPLALRNYQRAELLFKDWEYSKEPEFQEIRAWAYRSLAGIFRELEVFERADEYGKKAEEILFERRREVIEHEHSASTQSCDDATQSTQNSRFEIRTDRFDSADYEIHLALVYTTQAAVYQHKARFQLHQAENLRPLYFTGYTENRPAKIVEIMSQRLEKIGLAKGDLSRAEERSNQAEICVQNIPLQRVSSHEGAIALGLYRCARVQAEWARLYKVWSEYLLDKAELDSDQDGLLTTSATYYKEAQMEDGTAKATLARALLSHALSNYLGLHYAEPDHHPSFLAAILRHQAILEKDWGNEPRAFELMKKAEDFISSYLASAGDHQLLWEKTWIQRDIGLWYLERWRNQRTPELLVEVRNHFTEADEACKRVIQVLPIDVVPRYRRRLHEVYGFLIEDLCDRRCPHFANGQRISDDRPALEPREFLKLAHYLESSRNFDFLAETTPRDDDLEERYPAESAASKTARHFFSVDDVPSLEEMVDSKPLDQKSKATRDFWAKLEKLKGALLWIQSISRHGDNHKVLFYALSTQPDCPGYIQPIVCVEEGDFARSMEDMVKAIDNSVLRMKVSEADFKQNFNEQQEIAEDSAGEAFSALPDEIKKFLRHKNHRLICVSTCDKTARYPVALLRDLAEDDPELVNLGLKKQVHCVHSLLEMGILQGLYGPKPQGKSVGSTLWDPKHSRADDQRSAEPDYHQLWPEAGQSDRKLGETTDEIRRLFPGITLSQGSSDEATWRRLNELLNQSNLVFFFYLGHGQLWAPTVGYKPCIPLAGLEFLTMSQIEELPHLRGALTLLLSCEMGSAHTDFHLVSSFPLRFLWRGASFLTASCHPLHKDHCVDYIKFLFGALQPKEGQPRRTYGEASLEARRQMFRKLKTSDGDNNGHDAPFAWGLFNNWGDPALTFPEIIGQPQD